MKSLSFLLVTLLACAGAQQETTKPDPGTVAQATPGKRMASGDVAFDIPVTELKATLYEPTAFGRPGMRTVEAKKPIPLDKIGTPVWTAEVARLRAQIQSSKDPVSKQAQAAVVATMLYRESQAAQAANDNAKATKLWADARQILRDVAKDVGDKAVEDVTLLLLGCYELLLDDYPSAEKAWAQLIELDPKNKDLPAYRSYLAYAQLKQFKNAEALATVAAEKVDDKQPELAYVIAWAKWRANDTAGAWQAITAAAKGWGKNQRRDELEQNVLLFASRAGVAPEQAQAVVLMMAKDKAQMFSPAKFKEEYQRIGYELLAKLGVSGYGLVGRWADGVAALNKAWEYGADAVPANDRLVIRYSQADFTVKLDTPDVAAGFAKQAIDAVGACGAKCTDKEKADIVQGVYQMGRLFHILYATANDKRYYQPAHDLYAMTLPLLPAAQQAQAQQDAGKLETTLKNTKAGTGTHDKGAIGALLARHNPEIQTCYETAIEANPKVAGTVTLILESDATGAIKGATTEPKAGLADLSAVATCIQDRAKAWQLPKRGMAGSTRIKASYAFSIRR